MSVEPDMKGKVCLITGATSGLGKQTAMALVRRGATVLAVGRSTAKGQVVVAEINAVGSPGHAELLTADLSSQADIRELAAEVGRRCDQLHVLVNNAGAIYTERSTTADGIERTFALNHLAYFLLTDLLLPLLKSSKPARVVNVSSGAQAMGRIDFDDLEGVKSYRGQQAYSQSKLANVLFTYELARRLEGSGVTANCLHPGVVRTGFGREAQGGFEVMVKLAAPLFLTPEKGSRTSIYLATSPDVEGVTGKYFVKCRSRKSSARSYDEQTAARLWSVSETMTQPAESAGDGNR